MSRHERRDVCRGILAGVVFFLLLASSVRAQTAGTGALTGTVTDSSGAAVPNATVTASNAATGQTRMTTTSADGSYTISLLPPGDYMVKFEATGFGSVEIPSVTITVTETGTLNRSLSVGSQSQQVTVQADVEAIQTTNATVGAVITGQTVTDLPLTTRNYQNLIGLSPGANAAVPNASNLGKATTTTAVNGADTAQNNFQMDGVAVNNYLSHGTGLEGGFYGAQPIPNPDSIGEFKIQTSNYDAGYGRDPGANVNVVTKSGTNEFHGTAFEFFRNTVLNANDWFRKFTGGDRLVLNQNQYGGVFGGPIKKDKLFIFLSYQETGQKNGLNQAGVNITGGYSVVHLPPIPAGNRGNCPVNFTSLSQCDAAAQAFVPALGAAICPANNPTNPFDKVTIANSIQVACDGSNINPVSVKLLQLQLKNGNYYIPGSGISPALPYPLQTYSDPATYEEHQGMGNFDYLINNRNTLSGRYFYSTDPAVGNFPTGSSLPGLSFTTQYTNEVALLRVTSVVTNNLVNEVRTSFQRNVSLLHQDSPFTDTEVGITPLATANPILSLITAGGNFALGNFIYDYHQVENQFQWADQISWTHGKQTIRAGFEAEKIQADNQIPGLAIGEPATGSFPDFLIGRSACPAGTFGMGPGQCNLNNPGNSNGTSALSNITGVSTITNAVANGGSYPHYYRVTDLNAFFQDDVRISSRLTVNFGVRWEYDGLPWDINGAFSSIWPSLIAAGAFPGNSPATGTLVGFVVPKNYKGPVPDGVIRNVHNTPARNTPPIDNFAPRLGFAWQPTGNNRWVVRAGGGYFYDRAAGGDTQVLYNAQPFEVSPTPGPSLTLANPFLLPPTVPGPPGSPGFTPRWVNFVNNTNSGINNPTVAETWHTPLMYEWDLNTQYEFAHNWIATIGYVGSRGIHEAYGNASAYYNAAPLASPANPIHCGYDGVATDCITTSTAANVPTRVPYLGISSQATQAAASGDYKFNSLQATLRKQLSHGLLLEGVYTWSRAFESQLFGVPGAPIANNFVCCLGPESVYGLNPIYRPQRFVLSYVWNVPFGNPSGFERKLVEGWSVAGVTIIQNGTPLNIVDTRGASAYGLANVAVSTGQYCPGAGVGDIPTGGSLDSRVKNGYLNKTGVFCTPPSVGADGSTGFGDGGLGTVLGPGQNNWDISVSKTTTVGGLHEGATLEFRSEFFNAFNHPQFTNPVTNVNSAAFGQITSTSVNPRLIQFALKYSF
jgi:hypothetical protein